jgi:hypothetical protein
LLLVDYENVHKVDLSFLDDSYRAIVFVGAKQNPPRAASKPNTAHRFRRVEFQRIAGEGKNALDFHIAFHLGRVFETKSDTVCIVISRDKGYDALLQHLNNNGLCCRRVDSFADLEAATTSAGHVDGEAADPEAVVCKRCRKRKAIELHGGRWCTNCGSFASPPDPRLLPSNQPGYRERVRETAGSRFVCGSCHQLEDMSDGLYDDGEWMCGGCIGRYAR